MSKYETNVNETRKHITQGSRIGVYSYASRMMTKHAGACEAQPMAPDDDHGEFKKKKKMTEEFSNNKKKHQKT